MPLPFLVVRIVGIARAEAGWQAHRLHQLLFVHLLPSSKAIRSNGFAVSAWLGLDVNWDQPFSFSFFSFHNLDLR